MADQDAVAIIDEGAIVRIEFRRPEQHNAFMAESHRAFAEALATVAARPAMRVLLLQAQGRTFVGGGDFAYLAQLRDDAELRQRSHQEAHDIYVRLANQPVPVVAAVHGHALGVGATIVTASDIAVAWAGAKLADPHVRAGIVAGDGGILSWTAAAGMTRAKRMLLTGDAMTMREAWECGLVTDLVDTPEEALPAAEAIARRIAGLPPLAVRGTKRVFNAIEAERAGSALEIALLTETATLTSEDVTEALEADIARRPPVYANR